MITIRRLALGVLVFSILLVACSNEKDTPPDNQQLGPLAWDTNANVIIVRVDESITDAPAAQLAREIPACTVWGDGRAVWTNTLEDGNEVREGRLNVEEMRQMIQDVVFTGFYDWESDFLIPELISPIIRSITLNLYQESRTVTRYSEWPVDGYNRILEFCKNASGTPAIYEPSGGWLSAYPIPRQDTAHYWRWFESAGFSLSEIAEGGQPRWITGELLRWVWQHTILARSASLPLEGDQAYDLALRIPAITRDAPPPPTE